MPTNACLGIEESHSQAGLVCAETLQSFYLEALHLLSKYTQSVYISKCIDYAIDGLMKKYVFGKVGVHEVWTVEPPFTD